MSTSYSKHIFINACNEHIFINACSEHIFLWIKLLVVTKTQYTTKQPFPASVQSLESYDVI